MGEPAVRDGGAAGCGHRRGLRNRWDTVSKVILSIGRWQGNRRKHWETPDVINGVWDYGHFTATFAVEFVNGADGVGAAFYGTKQTLIADADAGGEIRLYETTDKLKPDQKPKESWKVEAETPAHVGNWLECCQSRKQPHSTIELGHRVITAAHLANLSYRTGKRVAWDAEREALVADAR
jgi:hypothetical protein